MHFSDLEAGCFSSQKLIGRTEGTLRPPPLRLGVIPGGSTDAVAVALHGTGDVVTAALKVMLGESRGIDVASVHSAQGGFERFSMTMASYGYFGDVLRRSDGYRWMGPHRYNE